VVEKERRKEASESGQRLCRELDHNQTGRVLVLFIGGLLLAKQLLLFPDRSRRAQDTQRANRQESRSHRVPGLRSFQETSWLPADLAKAHPGPIGQSPPGHALRASQGSARLAASLVASEPGRLLAAQRSSSSFFFLSFFIYFF
jgi:hypothetical protein